MQAPPPDDVTPARAELDRGRALMARGQLDDAVAVLAEAVVAWPEHPALRCFLALALHRAGHRAAALATLLDLVLEQGGGALDGLDAALHAEHGALLDEASR